VLPNGCDEGRLPHDEEGHGPYNEGNLATRRRGSIDMPTCQMKAEGGEEGRQWHGDDDKGISDTVTQ